MKDLDAPLALVGNSLAVLVVATERAQRGQQTVVINPGGPLGGYFAGVNVGGSLWDAGMVALEFTSFRTPAIPPPLTSYDPLRRNDVGRFTDVVRTFVEKRMPTRAISPLQMWVGDRMLPDLLLGNSLAALERLPCRDEILNELRDTLPSALASPWYAKVKDTWPLNSVPDYETVSRINHGHVLHDAVMAPFAKKILGKDTSRLHALFHRIPWLPLYWPQTLLAALEGKHEVLPETIFSHPVGVPVAQLCASLSDEMTAHPMVTLVNERVSSIARYDHGFQIRLEGGGLVQTTRLAWAQTPRQGLQACSIDPGVSMEPRLPLMLVFLRIHRDELRRDFSVIHAVSADTGLYRVNNSTGCAGLDADPIVQIVVEANSHVFATRHDGATNEESTIRFVMEDLRRLGVVAPSCAPIFSQVMRIPNALPLPISEGLAAWADERNTLIHHLHGIELLAGSAGPFTTSLSDQVVQGLKLAERLDD